MRNPRINIRKCKYDGLIRRWEHRSAYSLGLIDGEEMDAMGDYLVWVCTGVFKTRKEAIDG